MTARRVRYVALLDYYPGGGRPMVTERFAGAEPETAVRLAWIRSRSGRLSGEMVAYQTRFLVESLEDPRARD
jgi:hypothetical protein